MNKKQQEINKAINQLYNLKEHLTEQNINDINELINQAETKAGY